MIIPVVRFAITQYVQNWIRSIIFTHWFWAGLLGACCWKLFWGLLGWFWAASADDGDDEANCPTLAVEQQTSKPPWAFVHGCSQSLVASREGKRSLSCITLLSLQWNSQLFLKIVATKSRAIHIWRLWVYLNLKAYDWILSILEIIPSSCVDVLHGCPLEKELSRFSLHIDLQWGLPCAFSAPAWGPP